MSDASDYMEDTLIDHLFRTATFTKPTTIAIALSTAAISDSDTGSTITEPAGNGYTRAIDGTDGNAINPLDANWAATAAGNGQTSNVGEITFPTATGSWGTVTHFAIVDSNTAGAGNMWFHSALTASKAITTDDQPKYSVGALTVTIA